MLATENHSDRTVAVARRKGEFVHTEWVQDVASAASPYQAAKEC
jgi:hypothetical protein